MDTFLNGGEIALLEQVLREEIDRFCHELGQPIRLPAELGKWFKFFCRADTILAVASTRQPKDLFISAILRQGVAAISEYLQQPRDSSYDHGMVSTFISTIIQRLEKGLGSPYREMVIDELATRVLVPDNRPDLLERLASIRLPNDDFAQKLWLDHWRSVIGK